MNNSAVVAEEQPKQLSVEEKEELAQLEKRIGDGIRYFIDTGLALKKIRDSRLYRENFDTFEEYCQNKWQMGASNGHYLIASASVASNLEGEKPLKASHAHVLGKLPEDTRQEAWEEVLRRSELQNEGKITADLVEEIVLGYQLKLFSKTLGDAVEVGSLSLDKATVLEGELKRLPEKYAEAVDAYGYVDPMALRALRALEKDQGGQFADYVKETLSSGTMTMPDASELSIQELTARDVYYTGAVLKRNALNARREAVAKAQANKATEHNKSEERVVVQADGIDIAEELHQAKNKSEQVVGVVTRHDLTNDQLMAAIQNNGYKVLFAVVVSSDQTPIRFNGVTIEAKDFLIKPQWFNELVEKI